mmetsp:Transcript_8272/g.27507  ORF Transcript_8272/g.27507 Transcript_8272/m.27507 type:complete len:698 (+) Transcript_8272:103-2196(+)
MVFRLFFTTSNRGARLIDFFDGRARASAGVSARTHVSTRRGTASVLVHLADDRVAHAFQLLELILEFVNFSRLVTVQPRDRGFDGVFDGLLVIGVELTANVGVVHGVAHVVRVVLDGVLGFNLLLVLFILSLELLGVLNHALNVLLGQATLVVGDGNLVLLTRALVFRRNVEDTVGIDVEAHVNLRNATRRRRDTREFKLTQQVVVARARTFAFKDLDQHTRLVVRVRGEDLFLLGRNGGVSRDQHSHDTANGLETHGKRGNIEEEQVLHLFVAFARQNRRLHGGAVRDGFIRVDGLAQFLAVEEVGQERLNLRDTGRTTDQDDFVNLSLVKLGVAQALFNRVHALAEQIHVELFKASAGDGRVEVNTFEQRINFNGRLRGGRQRALGAFARGAKTAERLGVAGDVLLVLALELLHKVLQETSIEIFTTEVRITSRRLDFEDTFFDGQQRHIKGTTTEIKHQDALVLDDFAVDFAAIETVRERRGGWLVDDTEHVEASNGTGILGLATLSVGEIRRDGNHSLGDRAAKLRLGGRLHLLQNHGGNLLRGKLLVLAVHFNLNHGLTTVTFLDGERHQLELFIALAELATNDTLDVEQRVLRVDGRLTLGGVADETTLVGERHPRRGRAVTFGVQQHVRFTVSPHGDARVRRTEIDTDDVLVERNVIHLRAQLGGFNLSLLRQLGFTQTFNQVVVLRVHG